MIMYYCDILGTIAFAITGALVAMRKKMDLFGVLVLATVTSIGGGTFRDMMLGIRPVFWVSNYSYLIAILFTTIVVFFSVKKNIGSKMLLQTADAFGLAIFTIIGVSKTLSCEYSSLVAIVMGCVTGILGGMIRDILTGRIPLVLRKEIYATATIAGGLVFVVANYFGISEFANIVTSTIVVFVIRIIAIIYDLSLPIIQVR
ncbi:MAG: trimeric intracellular cation channel family protein [Sedimentisphaeraceae bacterium JB056]